MKVLNRREMLKFLTGGFAAIWTQFSSKVQGAVREKQANKRIPHPMTNITKLPESGPWPTSDPFLFCVHHHDAYPAANEKMGPQASLTGRDLGMDFSNRDGWSMYHGREVPGFPQHPHRGFETLTVVREGLIDHSDSLGAAARYGEGDAQWLTAGDGIVHAEMFPLLDQNAPNPLDLFQIWINLPGSRKRVAAHFSMLWNHQIPKVSVTDDLQRKIEVTVVAGRYQEHIAPAPPPYSWASETENHVAVWIIKMDPQAEWKLPATQSGVLRSLYVVGGQGITIGSEKVPTRHRVEMEMEQEIVIQNMDEPAELLLLQGHPIKEPVVQYGPFVMNSSEEIREAFNDYSRTKFGGWEWDDDGPIHGTERKRFARLIDGTEEYPG